LDGLAAVNGWLKNEDLPAKCPKFHEKDREITGFRVFSGILVGRPDWV
jgi:hypothetical protein